MSQQKVELLTSLQPAPDVDIAALLRNDDTWSALADAIAPFFHPDCEIAAPGVPGTETTHIGLARLRTAWLEWLEPWLTFSDEKVTSARFYAARSEAFIAAGLPEPGRRAP